MMNCCLPPLNLPFLPSRLPLVTLLASIHCLFPFLRIVSWRIVDLLRLLPTFFVLNHVRRVSNRVVCRRRGKGMKSRILDHGFRGQIHFDDGCRRERLGTRIWRNGRTTWETRGFERALARRRGRLWGWVVARGLFGRRRHRREDRDLVEG